MSDKQILITKKHVAGDNRVTVTGTVYESEGDPAIGASVMVKEPKPEPVRILTDILR